MNPRLALCAHALIQRWQHMAKWLIGWSRFHGLNATALHKKNRKPQFFLPNNGPPLHVRNDLSNLGNGSALRWILQRFKATAIWQIFGSPYQPSGPEVLKCSHLGRDSNQPSLAPNGPNVSQWRKEQLPKFQRVHLGG